MTALKDDFGAVVVEMDYHFQLRREMREWCEANLSGPVDITISDGYGHWVLIFKSPQDAMLFKLRWEEAK